MQAGAPEKLEEKIPEEKGLEAQAAGQRRSPRHVLLRSRTRGHGARTGGDAACALVDKLAGGTEYVGGRQHVIGDHRGVCYYSYCRPSVSKKKELTL